MNRRLSIICLMICATTFAGKPAYLEELKGLFLLGLGGRGGFTFHPGRLGECTRFALGPFKQFRCSLEGASATAVYGEGSITHLTFNQAVLLEQGSAENGQYTYRLSGAWKDNWPPVPLTSAVSMVLTRRWMEGAETYQGSLVLTDFGNITNGLALYPVGH